MRSRTLSPNSPVLAVERSLQSLEDLLGDIREAGELVIVEDYAELLDDDQDDTFLDSELAEEGGAK